MFQPLPPKFGVGYCSDVEQQAPHGFIHEQVGLFHNYKVTPAGYEWPIPLVKGNALIDGFSPNFNKYLHAGHLKNLAVGAALSKIAGNGKAVAMLGASQGVLPYAFDQYEEWCKLAQYNVAVTFDTELPPVTEGLVDGEGEYAGCKMYQHGLGASTKMYNGVVIYKSDGKPTYAAHDLSFAAHYHPTHYLTGLEQKGHFASLGLGDKHLALGLLLGKDGQKMKSKIKNKETGEQIANPDAATAQEVFQEVLDCLKKTPEPKKLAWNILTWQFNSGAVSSNTKFNLEQWAKPESPGLYITYTYAKMMSALKDAGDGLLEDLDQQDAEVLGVAGYFNYYFNKSVVEMEPCHLAQFALTLAKKLANVYNKSTIRGGKPSFIYAVKKGTENLKTCMEYLNMYPLTGV